MSTAYSYQWQNKKRDVLETYEIIRKEMPLLLGMIGTGEIVRSPKVEWMEDSVGPRIFVPTANDAGALTVTEAEAAALRIGSLVISTGAPDLFRVTAINGTSVTVALVANHGGSLTAATAPADVIWEIVADPKVENSTPDDGAIHQSALSHNFTQIFRKDVSLSRTAMQTDVYGSLDNKIDFQTSLKLEEMIRDMNGVLVFGHRQERSASQLGMAGGLYEFATGSDALYVDAGSSAADDILINDAIQMIQGAGGSPSIVYTCPAQARVIGASAADKVRIVREDRQRGYYVAQVVNALNGSMLNIVADPRMNRVPTDAWVLDPDMMRIRHMQTPFDQDSTTPGTDGIRRSILAETTFEFNQPNLRACRITNLKAAAEAIAALRS